MQAAPSPATPAAAPASSSNGGIIAGAAVGVAVLAFAAGRLINPGPSLATLVDDSIPLESALANGKPTVMEFYANW